MEISADKDIDTLWNALAHSKRRQIVNLLREGPLTTSEICDHFEVSRFAVMKHLIVLEEAGLVRVKREGRVRWNILDQERLQLADLELEGKGELRARESGKADGPKSKSRSPSVVSYCQLEQEWQFDAPAGRVFEALTNRVDEWWSRRGGSDSGCLVLETWLGGRFFERAGDSEGGFVLGSVSAIRPGAMLCLTGPLAMPGELIHSRACISLERAGEGAHLTIVHFWAAAAADELFAEYEAIWRELLGHLKVHVERGIGWRSSAAVSVAERA